MLTVGIDIGSTAVKAALGVTGFQAWIVAFLAEELSEEVLEPVAAKWLRGAGYRIDRHDGRVLLKALEEATNVEDRDRAVDDILG